jgi:Mg-chelatase subunit ChlD
MVASWVRRTYTAAGVTQYPPGPHLAAIAAQLAGRALLCIDVSGSMSGSPLRAAIDGGLDFLAEATEASYRCGLVLWSDTVNLHLPTDTPVDTVAAHLRTAAIRGGTLLAPTVRAAIDELGPMTGDRVVCVFSDGGIGDPGPTTEAAAEARALGIRFVVRGLGRTASASLADALRPDGEAADQIIDGVDGMRRGIASMAREMRGISR